MKRKRESVCQVLSVLRRYTITEMIWLLHKPTTSLTLVTTLTLKDTVLLLNFCFSLSTFLFAGVKSRQEKN